ncbi:hypothetical protein MRB53_026687 [Persea americana]|uniref:Uncharacterized protein n=1 Tax=Persea americana TaxID=3435 RepID=A0ACC2LJG8_PERAE|nr:hypothetical protein MRB53_026687 [Persea americana]
MDHILNWVKHLTDLGVFNLLVGAMDTKLLEALYWKDLRRGARAEVVRSESGLAEEQIFGGDGRGSRLTRSKLVGRSMSDMGRIWESGVVDLRCRTPVLAGKQI